MSDQPQTTHKFKLVGVNEGKTVQLGSNGQFSFVKGVCTIECNMDDAKRYQHVLGKFYSAKRVRPKNEVVEDDAPEAEAEAAAEVAAKPAKAPAK